MPNIDTNALLQKPKLMGVLNITSDSFYDGGKYLQKNAIQKRIEQIIIEGADIIDIGAQSTFVDRDTISAEEETNRVLDAIGISVGTGRDLSLQKPLISIDTYRSSVAENALKNGANIINDVTAMRADPAMANIISKYECPVILMYAKESNAKTTKDEIDYENIIETLKQFFDERINFATSKGIKKENIILDPGLGFFVSGKAKYSFEILNRLKELKSYFKMPILISPSRKSFLNLDGKLKPEDRLEGTLAASSIGLYNGADIIRTHDVKATKKIIDTMNYFS